MAEKVVVQLVLDTSRYSSKAVGAARDTAKIQSAADKTSKSVSGLGATALKAGAALGAAFAAKAALDFAKSSIKAFSSLSESVNAVEVSFGDAAEGVFALGENSATQFGLSTRAVNQAAVAMSAFADKIDEADPADAFGNVLQRATDFASVMDIDVEEALILFRSGLAGESEPLRKFGIDVSAATVTAVGLEAGLGGVNGKLSEGEKVQARYLAIMEQTEKTAGDFANTSEGLANRQRTLSAQWEEMQATVGEKLEPAMIKLLAVSTKLIPFVGRLGEAVAGMVDEFAIAIDVVSFFADLFGESTDEVEEAGERFSLIPSQITDEFEKFFTFISQGLLTQGADIIGFFTDADAAANPFVSTLDLMAAREKRAGLEAEALGRLLPIVPLDEFGNVVEEVTTAQFNGLSGAGRYNTNLEDTARKAARAAAAQQALAAQTRAVLSAQLEAVNPVLRLLRTQERLVAAQERQQELKAATGEEKATAEELSGALLNVVGAQAELDSATVDLSGSLGEGVDAFIRTGLAAGELNDELVEVVNTIGTFPTSIDIDLNVRSRLTTAETAAVFGFRDPKDRRHGGPVAAGEPFIVGEGGPELFIPDQAGRIIPNQTGGEQSIIVNVNNPTTIDLAADLSAGLIAAQVTQQVELIRI